ncbi:MAG: hypothetical protein M1828_001037, partial [Chrysothrix sp. TS-e1954]
RYRNDYQGIFWINSSSQQSVERDIALMFRLLYNQQSLAEIEAPGFDETMVRVKNWFLNHQQEKWLWIFDSADNVEEQQDPEFVDLPSLLPNAPSVQVLITTRSEGAKKISQSKSVEVGSLEPQQALSLFWKESDLSEAKASSKNKAAAKLIVEELGYLALAVTLAGSAISGSPRMCKDLSSYLQEYRED